MIGRPPNGAVGPPMRNLSLPVQNAAARAGAGSAAVQLFFLDVEARPMATTTPLGARVLAAYGGEDRWRAAERVEAIVSTRGLLLRLKQQPAFERMRVTIDVQQPHAVLAPREWEGQTGVLRRGDVRLEADDGRVVAARRDARSAFGGLRRALWWDRLDLVYFAGYAFWNYFAFPALLLREDVVWRQLSPVLLEGTFSPSLPTHSPVQQFHISESGFLLRHDYTAEVVGSWARAAHAVLEHSSWGGVPFASHRRVTPRTRAGRALRGPTLVEIRVHRWRIVPA